MAEVSASAVAVEQLDRQGRLNLQPAVAQAAQEWTQEVEEGEGDVGDNNQDEEEENDDEAGADSPGEVITRSSSCEERNLSSQRVRDNLEHKVGSSCDTVTSETNSADEATHVKLVGEVPRSEHDSLEEATDKVENGAEYSSLDIEDMRENLVSASEEAQQLLSDLNNR